MLFALGERDFALVQANYNLQRVRYNLFCFAPTSAIDEWNLSQHTILNINFNSPYAAFF